ncbi:MAG: GvpL/GvpF family gas vesicle protein [Chloroflexi bacterium]|nr:GvpL/GvpF family gas vesicle protein [Chloroflexota bacterium]
MSAMPRPSDVHAYVYCIALAEPFGQGRDLLGARASGVAGRAPRAIVLRDLAAVVSDADATRYDISRENLLAHQIVVEGAMAHSPVLPVRYGTVAWSDEDASTTSSSASCATSGIAWSSASACSGTASGSSRRSPTQTRASAGCATRSGDGRQRRCTTSASTSAAWWRAPSSASATRRPAHCSMCCAR